MSGFCGIGLAIYVFVHHILIKTEKSRLIAPGRLVDVNKHKLHVYAAGKKSHDAPTVVVLSALGMPSPVYFYHNLMEEISKNHRVVIVERAGMGYSEASGNGKDLDVILQETRTALAKAGESGPYILLPHSIGGFEARYWASLYPDEVDMIIGLDMLLPEYELANAEGDKVDEFLSKENIQIIRFLGLGRFEFLLKDFLPIELYRSGLTDEEIAQDKYLLHTALLPEAVFEEIQYEKANAKKTLDMEFPKCPVTLFVSDPAQTSYIDESWITKARELEKAYPNVTVLELDSDHHVHLHQPDIILNYIRSLGF